MKDSLLLLPQYVIKVFLCIGFLLLAAVPAVVVDHPLIRESFIIGRVLQSAPLILLVGVLFALFSSLVRLLHKPGIAYISFPLLLLLGVLSLHFGLFGLGLIGRSVVAAEEAPEIPLAPKVIHRLDEAGLFIGEIDGVLLRGVVVHESRNGFSLHPEAVFKPETGTLRLPDTGKDLSLASGANLRSPSFVNDLFSDLSYIAELLSPKSLFDLKAIIHSTIVAFFGVSLWTLLRMTKWPLFNFFFAFGVLRGAFGTVRFLGKNFLPEAAKVLKNEDLLAQVPLAFLALAGILLFFLCLVMKPLESWKRDLEYD